MRSRPQQPSGDGRGGKEGAERRIARAQRLIELGELSCGRQALEGAELALGTLATLRELMDPAMCPGGPREPLSALPE